MVDAALAHVFFFELTDRTDDLLDRFVDLCWEYLEGYPGQQHFSVGRRALGDDSFTRPVSAKFDVSVHMIFEDLEAYRSYRDDQRHEDFVTQIAGMTTGRIVYDSFLIGHGEHTEGAR